MLFCRKCHVARNRFAHRAYTGLLFLEEHAGLLSLVGCAPWGGTRPVDAADCVRNSVSCSAGRRPNAGELSTRTRLHDGVARRSPGPRKRAAIEATHDWPHKFRVRCLYNNDIRFGLLPYVMAAIVPQIWRRNIGVERMIVMLGYVWSLLSHSNTKRLRLQ